jgi:hypothetical protein
LQSGAHVRDRFSAVARKEQQCAEVSLNTEVPRIERNDFAQHRNGELWFLFLKIFLCLLFERSDFMLNILGVPRY